MQPISPIAAALILAAPFATAQSFSHDPQSLPAGTPFNAGFSENVEFLDIDGDGDSDCIVANGGDLGNEQNRLWLNRGGLQAGPTGVFRDETAARYPALLDDSRDVDFVDLDGDGDLDLFVSNTSGISNQTNRYLVNMGGAQGGAPGYFQDQTTSRWVNIGQNDGTTTHSSVAPSVALSTGGFIDWSCDTSMADLDGDGDPDLIEATYGTLAQGKVPARVFLNDGAGFFEEFNPSGYQLSGSDLPNGAPGLWCDGLQQHSTTDASGAQCDIANESISVDVGDFDGDFDLDFILGEKTLLPRFVRNRTVEQGGAPGFRDESWNVFAGPNWAPSTGSYEQDLGDIDNDGDLDVFGTNWSNVCDKVLFNDGFGGLGVELVVANSCVRHNEPDLIDYQNDGLLDVFTTSRTAPEELYRNRGPAGAFDFDQVSASVLPPGNIAQGLGADANDIDLDGDYDVLIACDQGDPAVLYRNDSQVPDTFAPRIPRVEQVPDHAATIRPTVVRAHVYDNAAWYVTSFNASMLEYRVNGGAFTSLPMRFAGGQVFRGEIPGLVEGAVEYRVRSSDAYGNTGVSVLQGFVSSACNGDPTVYCSAKPHSNGCVPQIGSSGRPSAGTSSGFVVTSTQTLDNKAGLLFYSRSGPKAVPYQGGYLCVQSPTKRTPLIDSGASGQPPCSGVFSFDFNAWLAAGHDPLLGAGAEVWAQFWSRDPAASFQTNRSDALYFFVCP